jgi:hypothetical protein
MLCLLYFVGVVAFTPPGANIDHPDNVFQRLKFLAFQAVSVISSYVAYVWFVNNHDDLLCQMLSFITSPRFAHPVSVVQE